MNFDTDNSDHVSLFNRLANLALANGFNNANGSIYFSDCIRDVEALAMTSTGDLRYWIVSDCGTWIVNDRATALDLFHKRSEMKAVFTIEHCETDYGTHWFSIALTD